MAIITLTTDFGLADHYVAAMKGVILTLAPEARFIDVTHDIRPQDVVQAAFVFRQVFPWFPPGTIHLIVVDPGVGTARRLLAARYAGQTLLAPDNGVISIVHHDFPVESLRELANERWFIPDRSVTFHGRDILAPVAGHLASGRPFEEVGPATDHLEILNLADATPMPDGTLRGYVIHVDHFGNLITNVKRADLAQLPGRRDPHTDLPAEAHVLLGDIDIGPVRRTYADAPDGVLLALVGSADLVEIAVNSGNAATRLNAAPGQPVFIRPVRSVGT